MGRVNFRKDFWNWEKIGQYLTGASSVTIPESIAGRISAPVPCSFRKWRITGAKLRKPVASIRPQALTLDKNFDHFKYSLRVNKKTFGVNIRLCLSQVRTIIYTSTG